MIILSETTDNLQVVLGGNITTNQLQCYTAWRDRTSTTFVAGRTVVTTNNTTDVNLAGSPAASTQRIIDYISIYNADTVQQLIVVKIDANGTEYILHRDYLEAGKTLYFIEGTGFFSSGASEKQVKTFTIHGDASANFVMTNATQAARFAGNTTRHLFMVDLAGYTQVRLRTNIQVLSASVNSPVIRIRYVVGWSATVGNFLQLGESAEIQVSVAATGYIDTGWILMATGARVDGVTIGLIEAGGDAAADPALGATDILFR